MAKNEKVMSQKNKLSSLYLLVVRGFWYSWDVAVTVNVFIASYSIKTVLLELYNTHCVPIFEFGVRPRTGREQKHISYPFPGMCRCISTMCKYKMDLQMEISRFDIFVGRNSGFLFSYSMFYIIGK